MPRRAAKIDRNQTEIVEALRKMGASVLILSMVGKGCPDIMVGYLGHNILMEIKSDKLKFKEGLSELLTEDQVKFFSEWKGQKTIVNSPEQAIDYLTKFFNK